MQQANTITYVNENNETLTTSDYTLATQAFFDAQETPTLANGTYVVSNSVTLTKRLQIQGAVTLILCDGATLDARVGVHNAAGNRLEVYGTAQEGGKLEAKTDNFHEAGIGGDLRESGGVFIMHSGWVEAQSLRYAAGIGGGSSLDINSDVVVHTSGGTISILGGKVEASCYATSKDGGAGIGGGSASCDSSLSYVGDTDAGTITISGGKVTAKGGGKAAGIGAGSGANGGKTDGGSVTIRGGEVTATGGSYGAGIGGGRSEDAASHSVGTISISGGTVVANGGEQAAGIGGGQVTNSSGTSNDSVRLDGGTITINGTAKVTANGGTNGAGIGNGHTSLGAGSYGGSAVTIGGSAEIHAFGARGGAGIGGSGASDGGRSGGGTIAIEGGTVEAKGGNSCAGIGGGYGNKNPGAGSVTVSGGNVTAKGGQYAAGIGSGQGAKNGPVVINGGEVVAEGGEFAAGIGGGLNDCGVDVTITDGTVSATGGSREGGAGIGSGRSTLAGTESGPAGNVTISGGNVTATGSLGAAGIGLGAEAKGGAKENVEIEGGTVTAQTGGGSGNYAGAQAVGLGARAQGTSEAPVTLYTLAKVLHSNAEGGQGAVASLASARIEGLRDRWAKIEPCEHEGTEYVPTQDKLHHTHECEFCLVDRDKDGKPLEFDHDFEPEGVCVCGIRGRKVSFDSAGGSSVQPQWVADGTKATKPEDPTKDGYCFDGWYADAALKKPYDFSASVTADLELHAKWVEPVSISKATVDQIADQAYTGKAVTPALVVRLGDKTLMQGKDYTLSYKSNVNAGTATVTATGKGLYVDSVSAKFQIVEPAGSCTATLATGKSSTAPFGKTCGTVGESTAMTSLSTTLNKGFPVAGGIEYRAHVQTYGWEGSWSRDGARAGRPGEGKRIEAVQMRLTGQMAKQYHVWYRVHSQTWGWLGWAHDGEPAGTAGQSKRGEAIEVRVLPDGADPASELKDYKAGQASYVGAATVNVHLQKFGWTGSRSGITFGTTGQARRLEAVGITVGGQPLAGGTSYDVHLQGKGWVNDTRDGNPAGTIGEARRLEAVRICLTGDLARRDGGGYSVWYRVHSQTYGWLGWAHDGQEAGTTGLAKRAEALEVQVLPQGQVPNGYDAGKAACVNG